MAALDGAIPAIIGAANAAGGDQIQQVDRSLRFNSGDSAYLNRTPSSQGNLKTYTLSCWIKRSGGIGSGYERVLSSHNSDAVYMRFSGNSAYYDAFEVGGGVPQDYFTHRTEGVFRDVGGWLHLVVAVNTTESVAADRIKFYVNGVQQTAVAGNDGFISQNRDTGMNTTSNHTIGGNASGGENLDGYLAETHFIDGEALAASDFGFYDENNNWQPKQFSGSYGTNGYYLKFADNSGNAALGTDSSGNGNTWTVNNINAGANTNAVAGTWSGRDGISFNGTDAEVTLSQNTDVNPGSGVFTFECYAYALSGGSAEFGIYDGSPGGNGSLVIRRVGAGTLMVERHNQAFDITGGQFSEGTWHHVAVTRDSSNNVRLFVDGTQSGSTSTSNTNNYQGTFRLGRTNNAFTNGYISNLRLIKGTALYTSNFTPPTGNLGNVSGTTLLMAQSTTSVTAATVKPSSLTISAPGDGSVIDSMIDTPTNYQADSGNNGGNYCTLSPLKNSQTLSDGNLDVVGGSSWQRSVGTLGMHSGKYYWEYEITTSNEHLIGVGPPDMQLSGNLGAGDPPGSGYGTELGQVNGTGANGSWTNTGGSGAGDIIGIAFDADNGNMYVYKNGSALNGGIASHTGLVMPQVPVVSLNGSSRSGVINFGQRPFAYTPPTDYVSLCSTNLADPAVADGSTAFDTTLYSGNDTQRDITGLGFSPDMVWIKKRSSTGNHSLMDTVRGATKNLVPNDTQSEGTEAQYLNAFLSDGFSLGTSGVVNDGNSTYVAWEWDAGTSTVTNTDGIITSSVRASQTNGCSIVSWTGNGSIAQTVGHGLNAAPKFIIAKSRDSSIRWPVFHITVGGGNALFLNATDTPGGGTGIWGNTDPTSSVFTIANDGEINKNGDNYIAYCFAPVEGFSAFGSYKGNASSDGPFVFTGFRPRWILFKASSITGDWRLMDTARDSYNAADSQLYPNNTDAEISSSSHDVDYLSNGFKVVTSSTAMNTSGATYVWAAFAEHPLKTARAR